MNKDPPSKSCSSRKCCGPPETVFYHVLPGLLLNELQRQQANVGELIQTVKRAASPNPAVAGGGRAAQGNGRTRRRNLGARLWPLRRQKSEGRSPSRACPACPERCRRKRSRGKSKGVCRRGRLIVAQDVSPGSTRKRKTSPAGAAETPSAARWHPLPRAL